MRGQVSIPLVMKIILLLFFCYFVFFCLCCFVGVQSQVLAYGNSPPTLYPLPTGTVVAKAAQSSNSSTWIAQNWQGIVAVIAVIVAILPTVIAIEQMRSKHKVEIEKVRNETIRDQENKQHEKDMEEARRQHERDIDEARRQHEKDMEEARRQHEKDVEEARRQHERDMEEVRKQHERDMEEARKERETDMLMLQEEIRHNQEREEREKEQAEKEYTTKMMTQSIQEHYRNALCTDPHIAYVQILGMRDSIKIEDVYVDMRILKEAKGHHELDWLGSLWEESPRSPEEVYRRERAWLNNRANTAMGPEEAIRKCPRCVIVGDPGSGKTMLLKHLALRSANNLYSQLPPVPIYIELNAFVACEYRELLDFAAAQWELKYNIPKASAKEYMESNLKIGHAMLLLDALDETIVGQGTDEAEASYKRVATAILQLSPRYPHAPIVVTARKAGYQRRPLLKGFTQLEVLDFRPEDIHQFVRNWFKEPFTLEQHRHPHASELIAKLERNAHVLTLAANPLLLSLIVIVYQTQHNLPERRAELYRRCVETLLFAWDVERNVQRRREFTPENKLLLLKEIAWHFHSRGKRYFSDEELLRVIASFMPAIGLSPESNVHVLSEIATEHGFLKAQAPGLYGFLHMTLQEYFVAQYVYEHNEMETLLSSLGDPWWEEVILLYAGNAADVSPLLQRLLSQEDESHSQHDIFETNLILAGQCLAARPTIRDVSLRNIITSRLFEMLTGATFSLIKEQCIEVLAAIGGRAINRRLLSLLTQEQTDTFVRLRIASSLGTGGERPVVRDLIQMLSNKEITLDLRIIIAESIGVINDPATALELLDILETPSLETEVHKAIIKVLGMLGNQTVSFALLYRLENEQLDSDIRCCIAEALGNLGDHSTSPDLLNLLKKEYTPQSVRCSIVKGLGVSGNTTIVHSLIELIVNEGMDRQVRCNIAEAIGSLGEKSNIQDLRDVRKAVHNDIHLCGSIILALGMLGDADAIPSLLALISNTQIDIRQQYLAIDALNFLGRRSVVPELQQLLEEKHLSLPLLSKVIEVIGNLGGLSVVHNFEILLSDEKTDRYVRQGIAHALGKIDDYTVVQILLHCLTTVQDPLVCSSIVEALGTSGDRRAVAPLLEILKNEQTNSLIRQTTARVLGRLANDQKTVKVLKQLLYTSDIPDDIHRALWSVSRRAGIRVSRNTNSQITDLEDVYWQPEDADNNDIW